MFICLRVTFDFLLLCSFVGYRAGACSHGDGVVTALIVLFSPVPIALLLVGMFFFRFYPINEKQRSQLQGQQTTVLWVFIWVNFKARRFVTVTQSIFNLSFRVICLTKSEPVFQQAKWAKLWQNPPFSLCFAQKHKQGPETEKPDLFKSFMPELSFLRNWH